MPSPKRSAKDNRRTYATQNGQASRTNSQRITQNKVYGTKRGPSPTKGGGRTRAI